MGPRFQMSLTPWCKLLTPLETNRISIILTKRQKLIPVFYRGLQFNSALPPNHISSSFTLCDKGTVLLLMELQRSVDHP